MFAIGDVLISDEVPRARFACALAACRGACCVQGEAGAPLEPEERSVLERLLPIVEADLRPEARAAIAARGVWEETTPGQYATTCVESAGSEHGSDADAGSGACVFVTYDGPVARCSIQQAHQQRRLDAVLDHDFPKPLSCHLFPLRRTRYGEQEVLNYEQAGCCAPARAHGQQHDLSLADVAQAPLVRAYGADWYARFRAACAHRAPSPLLPSAETDFFDTQDAHETSC